MGAIGRWTATLGLVLAMALGEVSPLYAQAPATSTIVRDGTIGGPGQPMPVPEGGGLLFEIGEGFGEVSGRNLFHSFDRLDVATPDTVRFTAAPGSSHANVIARVTGGRSHVYGTLESAVGQANLYLINPRGVVFGPDARIDVPAAFVVSGADEIRFADGGVLDTTATLPSPLSAVDPSAFGFFGADVGDLVVEGALEVGEGRDFAWIGGDVRLDGSSGPGVISAVAGDVTLVSVASAGTVAFDPTLDAPPTLSGFTALGRIEIVDEAILSSSGFSPLQTRFNTPGDPDSNVVRITTIVSPDGSVPEGATPLIDRTLPSGQRRVTYYEPTYGSPSPAPSALRGSGRVTIRGDTLLIDDADVRAETVGLDAESIDVELSGGLEIVKRGDDADVGLLATTGRTVRGTLIRASGIGCEGAVPACRELLDGNGLYTGFVEFGEPDAPLEVELTGGEGRGADIRVRAASVTLRDGARISTTSLSGGAPGTIDIETTGDVRLIGRDPGATGQPNLIESSAIASNHQGRPASPAAFDGGAITIDARALVLEDGGGVFAQTAGDGNAGDIRIDVAELVVRDDSQIDSSSSGQLLGPDPMGATTRGDSGEITVVASERVLLEGRRSESDFARLSTFSQAASEGGAGTIRVSSPSVVVRDGAGIAVTTEGEGAGGDIRIDAGALTVDTAGSLSASSQATVDPAGVIEVSTTGTVRIEEGGRIAANTGIATGGNVTITSGDLMYVGDDAQITANAEIPGGSGGRVTIEAPLLIRSATSVITASAPGGPEFQGEVDIRSPVVEIAPAVRPPEADFLDAGDLLLDRCAARRSGRRAGSFRVSRARGWPVESDSSLVAFADPPRDPARSDPSRAGGGPRVPEPTEDEGMSLAARGQPGRRPAPVDPMETARLDPQLGEAMAALDASRPRRALEALDRAVETLPKRPTGPRRIALALHLAEAYGRIATRSTVLRRSALLAAHRLLLDASAEAGAQKAPRLRSRASGTLGALYALESGRSAEALYLTRRARQIAAEASAPELEARWSAQVGRLLLEDGDARAAVTAYARAVELLDEVRRVDGGEADPTRFRRAVEPAYLGLVEALLEAASDEDPAEATRTLLAARDTVERWKTAELRDYFQDDCVAALEARARPLESIAPDAAIVYPIMLEDRLELLVSTRAGPTRYPVAVGRDVLLGEVERFREALQIRTSYAFRPAAEKLHAWLVAPYLDALRAQGIDTLVVVPDGALRTIPFGALHDGERFLIERVAVAVTPSLRLIEPRPFVAEAAQPLVAGLAESVQGFPALANVRREVEAVQSLVGGDLLVDARFAADRLETVLRERPPTMIHIASHAEFTGDPRTSFVLAHDRRLPIGELAGWIEANRFAEAPLELLVLSACETAAGDERAALGLAGLAIRAGARSVLGSLWSVNDEATSRLIVSFYEALAAAETSKVEALARSQRSLIGDRRFDHPFYWAGFQILNNWL